MSICVPTITTKVGSMDGSLMLVTWAMVTGDTEGAPIPFAEWADRSVQFSGSGFNASTIQLQGCVGNATKTGNDITVDYSNYFVLTDPQTTTISKSAAGYEAVIETASFVKPVVTAGSISGTVYVSLLLRRQNPLRT